MDGEQAVKKRSGASLAIILVLLFVILVLLFWISPLKELIFPSTSAPTITLTVVESAEAADTQGFFRVLIAAETEGQPEPQVQFSRNDGVGEVEAGFTLVLLEEDENYTLTAIATNTAGSAEAELVLNAGIAVGTSSDAAAGIETAGAEDEEEEADGDSEDAEDGDGSSPAAGGNHAPQIEAVIFEDTDISELVFRAEALPVRYEEGRHCFNILTADADGDLINFNITANHGSIVEIRQLAVDSVAFDWLSPANTSGALESLNVAISVTASDPSGANDRVVIPVALLPVIGEGGGEETVHETTLNATGLPELSGYVTSAGSVRTGVILLGDNSANEMIKGFLAFNIAALAAVDPEDIIATRIRFDHINKSGSPESYATWVDFKDFNYGPVLDARDFAVGGTLFYRQRAESFSSGSVIQGSLITQIRQAVAAGNSRFFVKTGLDAGSNSNGVDDLFQFRPENVILQVTYRTVTGG